MGKESESRKKEFIGTGKVTPVQIAFIVGRYLSDNSHTQTRTIFRSEASHLISESPVQEAAKSLLTLEAILDEYVTLKEQKVWMDQERHRLEQERLRIQNLLMGMQDVIDTYSATAINATTPPLPLLLPAVSSTAMVSQPEISVMTPAGFYSMYRSPGMMSTSKPPIISTDPPIFSTPITTNVTAKRKGSKDVSACPLTTKRSRRCIQPIGNLVEQSSISGKNEDKSLTSSAAVSSLDDNVSDTLHCKDQLS